MTSIDVSRIELLLREHFAQTDKQLADIRKDNAEFKAQIIKDNTEFKDSINARLDTFERRVNTRLESMQAQIVKLHDDNIVLKHDVAGLYHWVYWLLSIILIVFAMPQIVAGIKSLFGAITDGIAGIIALFRK